MKNIRLFVHRNMQILSFSDSAMLLTTYFDMKNLTFMMIVNLNSRSNVYTKIGDIPFLLLLWHDLISIEIYSY